ncbi:MAG: type II toxin-antitoxin system VapC family toxin [Actinomycetia bacterium]|nr:type II toxin-antitoxin system VapC family toxin [Actinomycetes bacterium]
MILVDTNVWSETTRTRPDPRVLDWLRRHHDEIGLNSVTMGELLTGLTLMPEGRRRDELTQRVEALIADFGDTIYPYNDRAARAYSVIRAALRRAGRQPVKPEDGMIAAIAVAHGFSIATRNVTDFDLTGVHVINPWTDH